MYSQAASILALAPAADHLSISAYMWRSIYTMGDQEKICEDINSAEESNLIASRSPGCLASNLSLDFVVVSHCFTHALGIEFNGKVLVGCPQTRELRMALLKPSHTREIV
jgi:hypothetical protein